VLIHQQAQGGKQQHRFELSQLLSHMEFTIFNGLYGRHNSPPCTRMEPSLASGEITVWAVSAATLQTPSSAGILQQPASVPSFNLGVH